MLNREAGDRCRRLKSDRQKDHFLLRIVLREPHSVER